jgi:hypothetical protein
LAAALRHPSTSFLAPRLILNPHPSPPNLASGVSNGLVSAGSGGGDVFSAVRTLLPSQPPPNDNEHVADLAVAAPSWNDVCSAYKVKCHAHKKFLANYFSEHSPSQTILIKHD